MEEEKCGAEKRNLSGKMRELERTFGAEKQNANEEVNRLKQRLSQLESELQHEKQKVTDKQFVVNRLQQQLEQLRQQQTKRLMQRLDKQAVPSSLMSHGLPLKSGLSFQNVSGGLGRNDHETPREAAQSVSRQKILADASFNGRAPALVPQNQRSPFQHLSGSNVTTSGQQSVARLGPNREELPQQSPPDSDQRLESNPDHQPDLPKLGSNFTTYGGRRLQHRRLYRNQSDSGGISRWRELPPSVQAAVNSSSMPDSNSSLPSDELRLMTVLPTVVDDRAPSGMNYRKKGSPSVGDVGHQDLGVQPTSSSVAVNRTVDQALQVPNSRTQVNGGHLEAGPLALTNVRQERNSEVLLNSTSQYNRSDTKNASNVTVVGMDFNVTENDQGRLYATYGISKNSGFGMVLNQSHTEETRPSDPNRMRSDSGGKPPTGSLLGEVLPELNTTVPPNQSTVGTNGSYDGVKAFVSENERTSENAPSREPRPIALAPPLGDVTASKDNASAELKVGKLGDGAVIKFGNASAANSWSPADTISSGSRNGTTVNVSGDDSRSQVLLQTAPMGIGVASTNQMRVTDRRRDQATFDVGNRHEAKQNETDVSESGVALEKESRRDGGPEHRGAEHERQWISSVNGDERQSQLRVSITLMITDINCDKTRNVILCDQVISSCC